MSNIFSISGFQTCQVFDVQFCVPSDKPIRTIMHILRTHDFPFCKFIKMWVKFFWYTECNDVFAWYFYFRVSLVHNQLGSNFFQSCIFHQSQIHANLAMKRNMISCAGAQINIKASWWKCAEFAPFITQIIIIIVT